MKTTSVVLLALVACSYAFVYTGPCGGNGGSGAIVYDKWASNSTTTRSVVPSLGSLTLLTDTTYFAFVMRNLPVGSKIERLCMGFQTSELEGAKITLTWRSSNSTAVAPLASATLEVPLSYNEMAWGSYDVSADGFAVTNSTMFLVFNTSTSNVYISATSGSTTTNLITIAPNSTTAGSAGIYALYTPFVRVITNTSACTPLTNESLRIPGYIECGYVDDGCGGMVYVGSCPEDSTCIQKHSLSPRSYSTCLANANNTHNCASTKNTAAATPVPLPVNNMNVTISYDAPWDNNCAPSLQVRKTKSFAATGDGTLLQYKVSSIVGTCTNAGVRMYANCSCFGRSTTGTVKFFSTKGTNYIMGVASATSLISIDSVCMVSVSTLCGNGVVDADTYNSINEACDSGLWCDSTCQCTGSRFATKCSTKSTACCYQCSLISNCKTCVSASGCSACNTGYHLVNATECEACPINTFSTTGTTCANCTGCADCNATNGLCTKCPVDYELLANGTCSQCAADTFSDGLSSCQACTNDTLCEVCNSSTGGCSKCLAGNGLVGSSCSICTGNTYSLGNTSCIAVDNCESVNHTTGSCIKCASGLGLNNGTCNSCTGKNEWSNGITDCIACTNCTQCDATSGSCTLCRAGTEVVLGKCIGCSSGLFSLGGAARCASCLTSGCGECEATTGACTKCQHGFGLSNSTCTACTGMSYSIDGISCNVSTMSGCVETNHTTGAKCVKCEATYGLSAGACGSCTGNTYSDGTTACLDGHANCTTCNHQTGACVACQVGFGVSGEACSPCTGLTFGNGTGSCQACAAVAHCGACDHESGACTGCETGYNFTQGVCLEITTSSASPQQSSAASVVASVTTSAVETSGVSSGVTYTAPPALPAPLVLKATATVTIGSTYTLTFASTQYVTSSNTRLDVAFSGFSLGNFPAENTTEIALMASGDVYNYTSVHGSTPTCTHLSSADAAKVYYLEMRNRVSVLGMSECSWVYTANATAHKGSRVDVYHTAECDLIGGYQFSVDLYYSLGADVVVGGAGSGTMNSYPAVLDLVIDSWSEVTPDSSDWIAPSACSSPSAESQAESSKVLNSCSMLQSSFFALALVLMLSLI